MQKIVDILPSLRETNLSSCVQERILKKFQEAEKSLSKSFNRCGVLDANFTFSEKSADAENFLLESIDDLKTWSENNLDCKSGFTFDISRAEKLKNVVSNQFSKHQRREENGKNCDASSSLKNLDRNKQVHKKFKSTLFS